MDVPQPSDKAKQIQQKVLCMKTIFWDHFENIEFHAQRPQCAANLLPYEYWIVDNATVRLCHFEDMGLIWRTAEQFERTLQSEASAFEAAGVIAPVKRPGPRAKREVKAEVKAYLHEKCKEDIEKYREEQAKNEEYINKRQAALEDTDRDTDEEEPPPKKTKTWDASKKLN